MESSVEIIEGLRHDNEALMRHKEAADVELQESQLECDTLRSIVHRLQQNTETLRAPFLSI